MKARRYFPYIWRPEKSEEILNFAETLTIAEGEEPKTSSSHMASATPTWAARSVGTTTEVIGDSEDPISQPPDERQDLRERHHKFPTYISGFGGYNYGKLFTAATKWPQRTWPGKK